MMDPRIAVYPGSFDPLTMGHMDIIRRALNTFDKVVIAVAVNPSKEPLFTEGERVQQILEAVDNDPRIEVRCFQGLLVKFAREMGARVIVRGLRAISDFEYEFQMAHMNHQLAADIETLFMMTGSDHFYVSSRLVKEVCSLGGDVESLVPPNVFVQLMERIKR